MDPIKKYRIYFMLALIYRIYIYIYIYIYILYIYTYIYMYIYIYIPAPWILWGMCLEHPKAGDFGRLRTGCQVVTLQAQLGNREATEATEAMLLGSFCFFSKSGGIMWYQYTYIIYNIQYI